MSVMMKVASVYLRVSRKPGMATAARARKAMAEPKGSPEPPRGLRDRHDVDSSVVGEFTSYTVKPRGTVARGVVVYLHGGAYISEIAPQHWSLVSDLVDAGLRVEVPLYGLAPEHTYRDAYAFLGEVYARLCTEVDPQSITVMGDSAGAGLALGLIQSVGTNPGRLVLISPWLDLALGNPAIPEMEKRDPWLSRAGLVEAGLAWAGDDDPAVPALSPINGPLAGLPATDVYIGTHDIFHPDALLLRRLAENAGSDVRVTECAGAVHVYPITPTPEGKKARQAIVDSVRPH